MDINSSGLHFKWNQKPKGGSGLLKKLDRIMGNTEFIDAFPGAYALFQPYIISDHSPAVLNILNLPFNKPKPFKIFNFLAHKSQFRELVSSVWNVNVDGHMMYQVVSKLKALKKPFRKLLHDQEEEAVYVQAFSKAKLDEERFLKQKAKIEWLEVGDSNSAYFHKSVKSRIHSGRINVIMNSDNIEVTGSNVADAFVSHYQMFLGSDMVCDNLNMDGLFLKKVSTDSFSNMVRPITDEEIKAAVFSIRDEHAPGPDGFWSAFFKKGWDLVSLDVCHAIGDFFVNGRLLKEINHTFIALIPKVSTPLKINDYRPISCCNVIYKCISTIITNRIIDGIKEVVSDNQSAFVPGIAVLGCVLKYFGFHPLMIKWIMACVTSTSFSLNLNGDIHGFFKGKWLRQEFHSLPIVLINVCFAYDLFIFARGDIDSARVIMESLEEFKLTLGLVPSIPKSTALFCNVPNHVKISILNIMPFAEDLEEQALSLLVLFIDILNLIRGSFCVEEYKRKAKLHGYDRCSSKCEGGLGLRSLESICMRWRDINGVFSEFSVSRAWEAFRPRGSFYFLSVPIHQSLALVRHLADMELVPPILYDIVDHLQPMANKRTARSIFGKLILAGLLLFCVAGT
ncbi:hypothetical protein Tco_0949574 [Tanacetum coccineum]